MSNAFDALRSANIGADILAASMAGGDALMRRQRERLDRVLEHAVAQSPFYRSRIGAGLRAKPSLRDFPIVAKRELMRAFDDWVTDPAVDLASVTAFMSDPARIGRDFLGRYSVWQTSGSTGEPAVFVQDAQAMAVNDSLESLRRPAVQPLRRLFDPWYLSERTAFVGATSGHFASVVSIERLRRLNPAVRASVRGFSFLAPLTTLCDQLGRFRPTVLATYPTAAVMLAEEAAAGRLDVALREVWTGGEALTDAMRAVIERRFDCPVVNQYGASEFLPLATTCLHGRLHHNCDWSLLENVDARGLPVPEGETGATVLLTNLANRVQPLVRYDLGDRIRFVPGGCACGSSLPVLEIEGRTDEVLVLRTERGRRVQLLPLALSTVLEDDAQVFDFQLQGSGERAIRLRLGPGQPDREAAAARASAALGHWLRAQGLGRVAIDFRPDEAPLKGRSGKIARVLCTPAAPDDAVRRPH
ncbi:MAG: phenylacetate--CoA ligase family protein [Lautropia sp.]